MAELADAAHAAAEHGAETTAQEYITHHLSYLTFGQHPDGHWGFAHTMEEATEMGFMAFHVDTLFWSLFLGGGALKAFHNKCAHGILPQSFLFCIS